MNTLHILYIDDERQREIIEINISNLKEIFGHLGYEADIELHNEINKIKTLITSNYYDVFVCDVTLRSVFGSKYGISIMHQIKEMIPNLIVIGISGESVEYGDISQHLPNFDIFIDKTHLMEDSYKKYIAHQFSVLFKSNVSVEILLDENSSKKHFEEDKKLIASNSFVRLLRTILFTTHPVSNNAYDYTDIHTARLVRITGGFSSSKVYRLICSTLTSSSLGKQKGETVINSVIKYTETPVDEPNNRTEKEVKNYLNFVKWYLPYTWRPEVLSYAYGKVDWNQKEHQNGRQKQKENGMVCYSFAYNDDVKFESLTDSILRNDTKKVHAAIEKIFSGKSKKWYSESNKRPVTESLIQYYHNLYFTAGSRPYDIVNSLVQQYGGQITQNRNYFIGGKEYPKVNKLFAACPITKYYTHICHGDLNTNNIIINEKEELIFIDFQDTGIAQVYYDFIVFELCLKLYFPGDIGLNDLMMIEYKLHNGDELPKNTIWSEMRHVREHAFDNSPSENKLSYNYGLAMRSFRLLRSKDLTDIEKRRLLACLLVNLDILYGTGQTEKASASNTEETQVKDVLSKINQVNHSEDTETLFTARIKNDILNDLETDDFHRAPVKLSGGMSGAEVYRIQVQSRNGNNTGSYIVKLLNSANTRDIFNEEKSKAQSINNNSPDDFKKHLVEYRFSTEDSAINAIIYKQANNNTQFSYDFSKLSVKERIKFAELISEDLLKIWNGGNVNGTNAGISDYFVSLLSERIVKTDSDSRFEIKAKRILQDPNRKTFYTGGQAYPNPFYYIYNMPNEILANTSFFMGKGHGDLHGRNIICDSRHNDYALIDYSHYSSNTYLLYDHAYLELDEYYESFKDMEIEVWQKELFDLISKPFTDNIENIEHSAVAGIRNAICRGINKWASVYRKNDFDGIEKQLAFARAAAGVKQFCLGFINDPKMLKKVYTYTAMCFKALFDIYDFDWDKDDITKFK